MKKILILLCSLILSSVAYAASPIDGYWQTIDDKSGNPKAVIQIYTQNGSTAGKVMGGYPVNGIAPHEICSKCPSPFTNLPVTGLQILWGMHYDAEAQDFEEGEILDPDSGHVYHAKLISENQGQNLKVRGYIGIPLFGRTQVWNRLSPAQFNSFMQQYYPSSS